MALAFVLIACVFIGNNWKKQISLNLFIFLIVFITTIVLQWIFNIINFTGKMSWIGVIYLFLFFSINSCWKCFISEGVEQLFFMDFNP